MAKRKVKSTTTRKALSKIGVGKKWGAREQLKQTARKMRVAMRKKPNKSAVSETVFKLVESANELWSYGEFGSAKRVFLLIDEVCDNNDITMPDEGVSLNIELDDHFGCDVLKGSISKFHLEG